MRITDSQVHIWEASRPDRPWDPVMEPHSPTPFTAEQLLEAMDEAGVDRAVLVPPRWLGYAGANEYALDAARAHPDRFAVAGLMDPEQPDAPVELGGWLARPGMKGIRLNLRWLRYEAMAWLWPEAARLGVPTTVYAAGGKLPLLMPVAERNPELNLIIDHAGLPAAGPDPFADLDQLSALARYPNVIVKLSGMTRFTKESYPFQDLQGHIHRLYDVFGPQRLAWGSDYTVQIGRHSYRETVDLIRDACGFLTAVDREWILDKTIARALGWNG